jgi:LmbE family N-acetylglucosaminyl deacetylase
MLELSFARPPDAALTVLCLGAHCDDIEIGCGGTVLRLLDRYRNVTVHWVAFSSDERREREAAESADRFLRQARSKRVVINAFRDGFLPWAGAEIKESFERLKQECAPDLIFTHARDDLHQDHRLIAELTANTYRDHVILGYEIPKYDGDLGRPNVFVPLDEATCRRKVEDIVDVFRSQRDRRWFDGETFLSVLRLRGIECNAPGRYAEAFHCRKVVWGLGSGEREGPA